MIAKPLISSLLTGSCGPFGHLDYRQQLLKIRGISRAQYLWTERPIAPRFNRRVSRFKALIVIAAKARTI